MIHRRSRSRSREHHSPVHEERLVSSRSQYAVSGCLHPMQGIFFLNIVGIQFTMDFLYTVDEVQGQQPMLFTGPDAAHSIDKRKNTKPHLVVDISGNILNSEGDSPSSIFDAIIAKLQVCLLLTIKSPAYDMSSMMVYNTTYSPLKRVRVKCCDISQAVTTQECIIVIRPITVLHRKLSFQITIGQISLNFQVQIVISIINDMLTTQVR